MHERAAIWQNANRETVLREFEVISQNGQQVTLKCHRALPSAKAVYTTHYTIYASGRIAINTHFQPSDSSLPNIPRMGMQLHLPAEFHLMEWYGKGPHETYWDRKSSGEIGLWKGTVWEQLHRYSRPQETGNKTEVRWMSLTNHDGIGLKAIAHDAPLSMSAWQLEMEELAFAVGEKGAESASGLVPVTTKHGGELVPGDRITWNIDYKQMGVGGDTSWGRLVHKEYTLPVQDYQYSFSLVPVGF